MIDYENAPTIWCPDVEEWVTAVTVIPVGPWRCPNCGSDMHRELL